VILIVASIVSITACSFSLPEGVDGSIAMLPFWDENQGIQGVQPVEGWSEEALLRQIAIHTSPEEARALILEQTNLSAFPETAGQYRGKTFTWDLYRFESTLDEVPDATLHFDLAVAERDSTTYIVALIALIDAYDANRAMYDAVFTHALYALEPME
jgi:hypothetical protein